jgi:hypothetical protein
MPCKAFSCRDFKSANSYLDGKTHPNHFQELLSAAGNYSIKVFNQMMLYYQQKKSP